MLESLGNQNIKSSLTGNLPKAVLFVRDADPAEPVTDVQGYDTLSKELYAVTENALKRGSSVSTLSSLSVLNSGNIKYMGFVGMEVQYNPNSIKMNTQAGKQVTNTASGGNLTEGQISEIDREAATTMSFQLVFDDMNTSDAFMMNSFSLTGDLITKGSSFINGAMGGSYSVQTQIDGLLSLLIGPLTRQVIFFWSNMVFRGELTAVGARYTMFNPKGNPIRGVVDLSIRQGSGGDGNGYDYTIEEKYWRGAFQKAFDEDGMAGVRSTFDKVAQNNFLNVNI